MAVKTEREPQLYESYCDWQISYWHPLQMNREFASHFQPRSRFRKLLINLVGRLLRRLLGRGNPTTTRAF